ncbi:MAG: hypothetical protein HQM01_13445, partial [Magnetococcales bacterium]|nr:hypothetical protein [Magnetococcales bacterium]
RIALSAAYRELEQGERRHAEHLTQLLRAIPGATVVELSEPMGQAAMDNVALYPDGPDGHPLPAGYEVMAQVVAPHIRELLPEPVRGLVAIRHGENNFRVWLTTKTGRWMVPPEPELLQANGWPMEPLKEVRERDIAGLPILGIMERDPERFGPQSRQL